MAHGSWFLHGTDSEQDGAIFLEKRTLSVLQLDRLVGLWCDRRAFNPLREVLKAYPIATGLTDEVHRLYEALRSVERTQGRELPRDELEMLGKIVDKLSENLNR